MLLLPHSLTQKHWGFWFGLLRELAAGMAGFRRYEDIDAWRLSVELRDRIFAWTRSGPVSRDRALCEQIRDSSRSAPRNLAEGFGRFRPREFANYARIARASLMETQNHLQDARSQGYIDEALVTDLLRLAQRALGATTNLIRYLDSCRDEAPGGWKIRRRSVESRHSRPVAATSRPPRAREPAPERAPDSERAPEPEPEPEP